MSDGSRNILENAVQLSHHLLPSRGAQDAVKVVVGFAQEVGVPAQNLRDVQPMQSVGRILLVEGRDDARSRLEAAAAPLALVESHRCFETARARLFRAPVDLLVTNVRLGAYNGLHLVYLSSSARGAPRCIVYSDVRDSGLAREVQRAGAFYEVGSQLPVTLSAYVIAALPDRDRRDPIIPDRRTGSRGGRRCWDLYHAKEEGTADVHLSSM